MSCASKSIRCLAIGQGSGSGWDYSCNEMAITLTPKPLTKLVSATETPTITQLPTFKPTPTPTPNLEPIMITGSGKSRVRNRKVVWTSSYPYNRETKFKFILLCRE